MQIRLKGEMTIADMRQALFETLAEIEENYAVRHSRGATLYINPTNGSDDEIVPINKAGQVVDKLYRTGPYRSAADEYEV